MKKSNSSSHQAATFRAKPMSLPVGIVVGVALIVQTAMLVNAQVQNFWPVLPLAICGILTVLRLLRKPTITLTFDQLRFNKVGILRDEVESIAPAIFRRGRWTSDGVEIRLRNSGRVDELKSWFKLTPNAQLVGRIEIDDYAKEKTK